MKRKPAQKTSVISALTARTQLGQIMKRATTNQERFVVGRRGKPSIVILSVADYTEAIAPAADWLKGIWQVSSAHNLDKLDMREIDEEVAAERKQHAKQRRA